MNLVGQEAGVGVQVDVPAFRLGVGLRNQIDLIEFIDQGVPIVHI